LGLLSHQKPGHTSDERQAAFYPQQWQANRLWQVFVQNVEALSKLFHVPTIQVTVYSAIADPENAAPDVRCLLFSIYFAATTTLSPNEVLGLIQQDKQASLSQFKSGLENSLAAANILDQPSIVALQALALYLVRAANPSCPAPHALTCLCSNL
jgi:hypothetical protein